MVIVEIGGLLLRATWPNIVLVVAVASLKEKRRIFHHDVISLTQVVTDT